MGVFKKGIGCAVVLLGGFLLLGACVTVLVATNSDKSSSNTDKRSNSGTFGQAPPSAVEEDHRTMARSGTYQMGGIDGKDWGVYQATATGNCEWSIRSVARYRAGLILDSGTAGPGETVRVNIQADGDVSSWSGEINNDHRLVFMTNGCGVWQLHI
ncbi:hypothetical protein [Mycobacterium colombiense]|uniref:hypothetical protein n=1 Tax=Mycobacterium colombiense TaxID=339268 RepID=UPI0007FEA3A3|nr:hypothetical protein [Mycobacterium colombiense]OBJ72300.1 hypothetical protein A5627_21985 [Mycobacterium colombiense]